jgi:hypothetical protein
LECSQESEESSLDWTVPYSELGTKTGWQPQEY